MKIAVQESGVSNLRQSGLPLPFTNACYKVHISLMTYKTYINDFDSIIIKASFVVYF
jgi:hypothetical protein